MARLENLLPGNPSQGYEETIGEAVGDRTIREIIMVCQDIMQTALLSSGIVLCAAIALISFGALLREVLNFRRRV